MLKADGTFMVWADGGGPNVKPLNWMIPPTVVEEERSEDGALLRPDRAQGKAGGSADIGISEVLSEVEHELEVDASLEKEGVERELQELLAGAPEWCGRDFVWCDASGPRISALWT